MAALVLGLGGAALGGSLIGNFSLFGATFSGSGVGWALGSMLGGQLFRDDLPTIQQQGPRISDFRIQSSTYGQSIPRVFGRARLAGNLIWSSGLIESVHTSSQTTHSGKGGGGGGDQTVVTTTYSYAVHLAIGICEGPVTGVRKIWANGTLIYNAGDGASAETVYASNSRSDGITIYAGTSTQPVDPLVESYVGSGNAPAYRSLAYVVLNNFQLADFGNRIPNFEFEVLKDADADVPAELGDSSINSDATDVAQVTQDNGLVESVSFDSSTSTTITYTHKRTDLSGNVIASRTATYTDLDASSFLPIYGNWLGVYMDRVEGDYTNVLTNASSGAIVPLAEVSAIHTLWKINPSTAIALFTGFRSIGSAVNWSLRRISINQAYDVPNPGYETVVDTGIANSGHQLSCYWDGASLWLADINNGNLYQYDAYLTLLATYTFTALANDYRPILVYGDRFYIGRSFGNSDALLYSLNTDFTTTLLGTGSVEGSVFSGNFPTCSLAIGKQKIVSLTPLLTNAALTLDDVVTDLCESAGLTSSDINVSALSSTSVTGYIVGRRSSLRSALEPLMAAYFFDAVESDGKLKFVLRSGSSVVTIPGDDLAAHEAGGDPGNIVDYSRTEELALPNEITVAFINDSIAYQMGAQYARRLSVNSDGQVSLELPIVMTDPEAKAIADAALYDAWRAREAFAFRTSRKYAKYEPGDVVTIPNGDDSVNVRITQRDDGANGIIEFRAALSESTVYTQAGTTQEAEEVDDAIGIPGPTDLELMDIPQLRDEFDRYGFYAATHGWLDGWRGAALYRSLDGGGSYAPVEEGVFVSEAAVGIAQGVLAAPLYSEQFDEKCSVSIQLHSGTLASVSRDEVLAGANFCLLGDELLQFRDATQTAANTYTLSGLLRGRLGTETAMTTHATGERFVLLSDSTVRFIPVQAEDIGVERIYRAPSFGNYLQTAPEQAMTYEGINLTPLSPVHVRGGRDASLNLTITWVRRTRARATWRDFVDAPLAEESESYEVDIYNGSSVVRTISVTSASASYTAAQQTTDFGSTQASVVIAIYQISARVGRGFPANATV